MTSSAARMRAVSVALSVILMLGACAGKSQKSKSVKDETPIKKVIESNAIEVLTEYAEKGDPGAQYDLGLSLSSTQWLETAAMQGYGPAAYELGLLQDDPKDAVGWYSMASAMGHVGALYQIGDAYLNGHGTAKEPGWGLMWLERAARAGHGEAQHDLGVAMAEGVAGKVRRQEALTWLMIAQIQGGVDGEPYIGDIKKQFNASTIETIEQRARQWRRTLAKERVGDRASIRFAQYAMSKLGYAPGTIDGIDGEQTYTALVAFRQAEGFGNGGLNGAVLDRLREKLAQH
ncbi:MAG: SEL1-like repeat protein [Magnetovibrio sp.]|nr:SEL1-like repeat protein [Magnetovibrio sp.]